MEEVRKGDVVLGGISGPDAQEKLVSALLRVYKTHSPDQLRAFLARPKPLVLVRGIDEARARKLMEFLQARGAVLRFVPSSPAPQAGTPSSTPPQPSGEEAGPDPVQPAPSFADHEAAPEPSPGGSSIGLADTPSPPAPSEGTAPPSPEAQAGAPPPPPESEAKPRRVALRFTGTAGEYFRIWIVNVGLTILTLGIYGAWAKVRTRRYFYANTLLDGQPFDYLARPRAILTGYLLVGGGLLIMNVSNRISPIGGSLISAAAWCTVPFLLYKAHRFKAKYSAYRNIRFRFTGTVGEAYKAYAFIPLGVLLGLAVALPMLLGGDAGAPGPPNLIAAGIAGLLALMFLVSFPYFMYLQRHYLHDNLAYGKTRSVFKGTARRFYGIYGKASLMMLGTMILGGVLIGVSMASLFAGGDTGIPRKASLIVVPLISYILFGFVFLLIQQYIYAGTFNYSWSSMKLGPITFSVSLRARTLAWIRLTNVLAIILSLGLLAPWAKVRRARYILPLTTAVLPADMGAFQASKESEVGAAGDAAADFFDWDIGW